ncbi:hypothetical protein OOK31_10340 [Streptomyces sp. NBC_00249]|uniref:hypothetical protein n=1 Tax=Streptomyces sp. NBC_00249 TaxID=2975690 RepID=UPI00224EC306|nr:hypothetical protein [Streptomyces sp. NBC_00249]MCX5194290.1 hypothetical protein [Streptomyces sp. NBC_00249]
MGLTQQLESPDPRDREAAARQAGSVVWDPDTETALAAALTRAACAEEDPAALAAQLEALPAVEAALSDADLERLCRLREPPDVLGRLLARAGRLQIAAPARPSGAATLTEVRCLRGAPRTGQGLRTPDGAWVVLERIEFQGRAVSRVDTGRTARVLLSGPGARGLGEWDRLDADPRAREYVRMLRAPDPRTRDLAAAQACDWPGSWDPETGRLLCAALARAARAETDPAALESELNALLQLGAFLAPPALALLRTLDRTALPPLLRPYLDDLLLR